MNANFGLVPPLSVEDGKKPLRGAERKMALAARALADFRDWIAQSPPTQIPSTRAAE
jgi:folate-dependent tRNA-U54 methylase TrmFO/GidA